MCQNQVDDVVDGADQAEEDCCHARTAQLRHTIQCSLRSSMTGLHEASTQFSTVAPPCSTTRKLAAAQFSALLALKKRNVVNVQQLHPFADIKIWRGPEFDTEMC